MRALSGTGSELLRETNERVEQAHLAERAPRGLTIADFRPIGRNGFGDPQNAYSHSMAYFNGQLYVGTTRNSMALLKLFPPIDTPAMDPWPVRAPSRVQDLDMRGQIWRWSGKPGEWEQVFRSPLIFGKDGEEVPRDLGFRGMAVFQGRSDPAPALYVASMSTVLRGTAAHILRTYDGTEFVPVSEPGLGNPNISTFRALVAFDGHLYVPPAGEGVTFNTNRRSVVMRSADPDVGSWEPACEPGFGDPTNNGIFEMVEFNGHLYAGTFNHYQGYQIWKTPANGGGPCRWTKVIERGAYRGPLNEIAMSLCPFDGALYVGSAIQNGGYDRYNLVGPAAGEIIRIYPDDSWDLLVGTPRETPDGVKYPLSGLGPGFDNIFAAYIWRMVVHDGWLYVTTFDWSIFLLYANRASPTARRLAGELGVDRLIETAGGFELRRTKDGVNWITVSPNGLGNPFNYGGRTLVSTPEGLFIGTANPFGPEVAAKLASPWTYVPNPDGGTEVWLGKSWENNEADNSGAHNNAAENNGAEAGPSGGETTVARLPAVRTGSRTAKADVLVTGATGFIGKRFVQPLLREGHRVRVLALPETVDDLPSADRLDVIEGGLDDRDALARSVKGVSVVCHLAARLGGSCPKPELRKVNVDGTHALLKACARSSGLRRFVFASSAAVYQGQYQLDAWPLTEASALRSDGGNNLADYGISKVAGENLVRLFAQKCGFEYVILRFSLCYGVGNADVERLVHELAGNEWFGRGRAGKFSRQYIHVDDAVEGLMRAAFAEAAANEVFNMAGGESITNLDVGKIIRRLRGMTTPADLVPDRTLIWRRYVMPYDIGKARRTLDFVPSKTMHEGLAEILEAGEETRVRLDGRAD